MSKDNKARGSLESSGSVKDEPSTNNKAPPPKSGMFPIDIMCGVAPLSPCPPPTWRKIQDCVHLVLMIAVIFGILSLLGGVLTLWDTCSNARENAVFACWGGHIIVIIYALLLLQYCYGVISQYDEDLMHKQKQVRQEKAALMDTYKDLLSDMDGLLQKSTESAAGLAERSFESKRRDFLRFLDRAIGRMGDVSFQNNDVLEQFRKFVMNWMEVFKEASIDPVGRPALVITEEEMMRCTTVSELCEICAERLRAYNVTFISTKREENGMFVMKNKKKLNQRAGRRVLAIADAKSSSASFASDDGDDDDDRRKSTVESFDSYDEGKLNVPHGAPVSEKSKIAAKPGVGWFECGSVGCGFSRGDTDDGFPMNLLLGCMRLSLMSPAHVLLILDFLLGLVCVVLLFIAGSVGVVFVIATLPCLVVVLMKFSDIDIIEQLKREVSSLQTEKKTAEKQKNDMNAFWGDAQKLTDLWLCRTVPRLDLYKEVHVHLEDVSPGDLLSDLKELNKALEGVEEKLGSIEDWRQGGALTDKDKQAFGHSINNIVKKGESSTQGYVGALQDISRGPVMQRLALTSGK